MGLSHPLAALRARGHKYHAQRTSLDGISFASKAEATRYLQLKLLQKAGVIRDLVLQPRFPLYAAIAQAEGGPYVMRTIGHYVADFEYIWAASGELRTEDVKGVETDLFKWKKRHFELQYGRFLYLTGGKPAALRKGRAG
jgi:Protein of unknown function (DUF1064)